MSLTGTRQKVKLDEKGELSCRLFVGDLPYEVTSCEVQLFSPSKSAIGLPVAATISSSKATVSLVFSEATYPRDHGYVAEFDFIYDVTEHKKNRVAFDVVHEYFDSVVTDADIRSQFPNIRPITGEATLLSYRQRAWRDIERTIKNRLPMGKFAEDIFYPEDFFDAHVTLTAAAVLRSSKFEGKDDEYERLNKDGYLLIDAQMKRIDVDFDGDGAKDSTPWNFSGVRFTR